jgi:heat shock protein HtpX
MNFGSYWFSDKIVLRIYGAEEISESQNPELHSTLEELAENAGIPKPRLYRSSMKVPNAFATGRSPKKGVVCVTDGLLQQLNDDEVAGVIAHELAHIKNRDTLINASVATIAGAISVLAEMAFWGAMFGRGDEDMADLAGGAALMILTPLIATLIRMAISRKMEYRADSSAVQIQGQKEALGSALQKISSSNESTRMRASRVQEAGSNLFIYNPFTKHKLVKYFSTHPPLDQRLKNIEDTKITT